MQLVGQSCFSGAFPVCLRDLCQNTRMHTPRKATAPPIAVIKNRATSTMLDCSQCWGCTLLCKLPPVQATCSTTPAFQLHTLTCCNLGHLMTEPRADVQSLRSSMVYARELRAQTTQCLVMLGCNPGGAVPADAASMAVL